MYEGQLGPLGLFSPEQRRLRGGLMELLTRGSATATEPEEAAWSCVGG